MILPDSSTQNHLRNSMDILAELETLAATAELHQDFEPSQDEVIRWQNLFKYTYDDARKHIEVQKNDFARNRLSDEHWMMVKLEKESQGFSRDAYEHWISLNSNSSRFLSSQPQPMGSIVHQAHSSYLIRMEGILSTAKSIQDAADLPEPPQSIQGSSENVDVIFCIISGKIKRIIETWLMRQSSPVKPTFIRLSKALKDLDSTSIYPTLGREATFPQHRLSSHMNPQSTIPQNRNRSCHSSVSPLQEEYPVWYFSYGSLAKPATLSQVLSLSYTKCPPIMTPACISGGIIKSWGGKYKALVDGTDDDIVHGSAYQVQDRESEESLLVYETEKYEVVRCIIESADRNFSGLTFRFMGSL